jgi:peptide/nickel transport system substrate-binding protein
MLVPPHSSLRAILALGVAAALGLAAPARADGPVLRHVPPADLKVLDPITNTATITMEFAYLVYDQLFAVDEAFRAQPQMVESYAVEDGGRSYRFTLRPGLAFHDGSPVRAADAVASIRRWAKKDPAGMRIAGLGMKLAVIDDRSFSLKLNEPYGQVVDAMAKPGWALFVMPERDAAKEPNDAVATANGSGPFRLVRPEWVPGSKVVFEKNPAYVPRAEPANGYAGGRVAKVGRVEWDIIPDTTTAVQALAKGEVDVVETVPLDLMPMLKGNDAVVPFVFNRNGYQGEIRPNFLYPPFDNPKIRQALLAMVDQADYMGVAANDRAYWQPCWAWLICGSPMGSEAGTEALRKPDIARAKALLQEAGYKGEKVVVLSPSGLPIIPDMTRVMVQELKSIGMNVDELPMEWSTLLQRRFSMDPPDKGGWSIYLTYSPTIEIWNPITTYVVSAPCDRTGWPGWPCDPAMEKLRTDWSRALDDGQKRAIAEQIQLQAVKLVPIVPLGQFTVPGAYRSNLHGLLQVPIPVMWNVEKGS